MLKLYRVYFAAALLFGFHKHVLRISNRWGGGIQVGWEKSSAAWSATQMLIDDGYHACPSCGWATKTKNEHVNMAGSPCHHEHQLNRLRQRPVRQTLEASLGSFLESNTITCPHGCGTIRATDEEAHTMYGCDVAIQIGRGPVEA